jgi:uncharacterized protein (DUF1800 family)
MRSFLLAAALVSMAAAPSADVEHALNRLAFGARPGDVARVEGIGLTKWIDEQLRPERISDADLERRLAQLRRETARPAGATPPMDPSSETARMERRREARASLEALTEERLLRAIYSERQLQEVLVDFWFNHFNVFARKGQTAEFIDAYEREVIRPHVLGRFRDLLEATAKSPAMLFYLDNWMSTSADAPAPPRGPQAGRKRGLNENYARELVELHTLGVDGGYTQQDVVEIARAFTGWTIDRRLEGGSVAPASRGFRFAPRMHDRGEKTVLGQTIRAGGGIEDGERVLDIVAQHPSTARHIARKLAQRFISDTPPAPVVERAAERFRATRGDLRETVRAIVTSPEFLAPAARGAKIKTPLEYVVSALRATSAEVSSTTAIARALQGMGMPLFLCQPPTGYDETAASWISSGALVTRINFASALGDGRLRGVTIPAARRQGVALTIGSAEFQRQ